MDLFTDGGGGGSAPAGPSAAQLARSSALRDTQQAWIVEEIQRQLRTNGATGTGVEARRVLGLGFAIVYTITSGDGSDLVAGDALDVDLPLIALPDLRVTGWVAIVNAGTITFDVQRAARATSPAFSSIVGGAPPAISTGTCNWSIPSDGSGPAGWSFTGAADPLVAESIVRFRTTACSGVARASLALGLERLS